MIPRLHTYWVKEFSKFFCMIQVLILVLFVIIDYLSRLDKFINSDLTLLGAFGYVLLKVPFMFIQITPASTLLATITVFSIMNRNNELLAVRSAGISVYFLVMPAVAAGLILSGMLLLLGETLVPVSMAKANHIEHYEIKKSRHGIVAGRKDIWIKSDNRLVHIHYFDPVQQTVSGITISTMDDAFLLSSRIDAKHGVYENGYWRLTDVLEQRHAGKNPDYDVVQHTEKKIRAAFKPGDLENIIKQSDEMSYYELKAYVAKVEREGYDAVTYRVDMYGKIAFPFVCIIMVLTGAATGMRSFAKENLPAAVAVGVVIAFVYWVMYGFCLSLGYGGILPPVVSAWVANLFFACLGILYLVNTE